jgi:hypothetical protein
MQNRLTNISLNASDPDDWRTDYVRVQFNDGCFRGRFFYIKGPTAQLVLETVARVCLEGWMQANSELVDKYIFELDPQHMPEELRAKVAQ